MNGKGVLLAIGSAAWLFAGVDVQVSVCNEAGVPPGVVRTAKSEAATLFETMGVGVEWFGCGEFPPPGAARGEPLYIVRLRGDRAPQARGPLSLEAMGKAWVPEGEPGDKGDAYLPAIEETAERQNVDEGVLLGYVVAHELGHLLMGAGHSPEGVMRARWGRWEMQALRQRWLRFSGSDGRRVRGALAVATSPSGACGCR